MMAGHPAQPYAVTMTQRFDLHTHSTASDGTLSPAELVARAVEREIDQLALTDHDTTAGLEAARVAAREQGLGLIPGIELSVSWAHQTLHIVGLHIDPGHPAMQAGIARQLDFRRWRAAEIGRRLAKAGIDGAYDGACGYADGDLVGRTHFARYLVEQGHARDLKQVFKRYLVRGKPGHVAGEWATLEQAVGWIRDSGGLAVIAHPARYKLSATRLRQLLGEFGELGGAALEVVSGSHSRDDMLRFGQLSQTWNLAASSGSDYHGPENPYRDIGRLPELPPGCRPIWESDAWARCSEGAS
ncbi:MAG: PHP domain-containing protein [Pseudomonadota bacterium]